MPFIVARKNKKAKYRFWSCPRGQSWDDNPCSGGNAKKYYATSPLQATQYDSYSEAKGYCNRRVEYVVDLMEFMLLNPKYLKQESVNADGHLLAPV